MSRFVAPIPQTVQPGDRVRVRGTLEPNAQQFSINFANDCCPNPENITYHFKWLLNEQKIVQNYKMDGNWIDHQEIEYNDLDEPQFALEFAIQEDGITVYLIYKGGYNNINNVYELNFDISEIKSVQVWGDYAKVNEMAFLYN